MTLQNLLLASGVGEEQLLAEARSHAADWERWLVPIDSHQPVGEDPGYDDDFQRIREEVNLPACRRDRAATESPGVCDSPGTRSECRRDA